jgi:hypothetical protein
LPFDSLHTVAPTTFYPFAQAYVFRNWFYGKQENGKPMVPGGTKDSRVAWVLNAVGEVKEYAIHEGPWTGGPSLVPYLTARGLAFVSHGSAKRAEGIYLSNQGRPERLLRGHISAVGVSADGCLLAFSSAATADEDRANAANRRTLKSINICAGNR